MNVVQIVLVVIGAVILAVAAIATANWVFQSTKIEVITSFGANTNIKRWELNALKDKHNAVYDAERKLWRINEAGLTTVERHLFPHLSKYTENLRARSNKTASDDLNHILGIQH